MARRVGVDREQVLAEAMTVLDEAGDPNAVTLAAVASRVGIRTQSLYAHVDGAAGLRRDLALRSLAQLAVLVTDAAVGRASATAVEAVLRARLDFALAHPGRFAAAIHPPGSDPELNAAIAAVSRPLTVVSEACGIPPAELVHWDRIATASTYGFALMARDGQLTLPVDVGESADRMIALLTASWAEMEIPVGA